MSQDDFLTEIVGKQPVGESRATRRRTRRDQDRRRRRRRRIVSSFVLLMVLSLVAAGGYFALRVVRQTQGEVTTVSDYTGAGTTEVVVTIPEGATGQQIGQILKDAGVVATVGAFTQAYNANANASSIHAGTYTLKLQMSAANAVAALLDPISQADHTLTIPEGATRDQVKDKLQAVAGFTPEDIDAAFADPAAIGLPDIAAGEVEGWLAPSTYDIPPDSTATEVIASMVATTVSRLNAAGVAEADYETVLNKASIVEREGSAEYYAKIARVIDNRLADTAGETRGLLGMDSTVLYGLGRSGGMPTSEENADSSNPYNTYQHAGLPPTPIGSPGQPAIEAVVHPAEGDWLYFVTVNLETKETLFALTLAEQQANTEKLSAYCAENPDKCTNQPTAAASGQ